MELINTGPLPSCHVLQIVAFTVKSVFAIMQNHQCECISSVLFYFLTWVNIFSTRELLRHISWLSWAKLGVIIPTGIQCQHKYSKFKFVPHIANVSLSKRKKKGTMPFFKQAGVQKCLHCICGCSAGFGEGIPLFSSSYSETVFPLQSKCSRGTGSPRQLSFA